MHSSKHLPARIASWNALVRVSTTVLAHEAKSVVVHTAPAADPSVRATHNFDACRLEAFNYPQADPSAGR